MFIIGHGVDIVDVDNFANLLNDGGSDFVQRCFTSAEQLALDGSANRVLRLAGRFAAKEAVAKALGTGFTEEVAPVDIEITNTVSGPPVVTLSGGASIVAARMGIRTWYLSLGHTSITAIASAIAVGGED